MSIYKFHNVPTEVDGHLFPSKAEAFYYCELKLELKAGEIRNLELQPRFPIVVAGHKICTYVGDFMYDRKEGNRWRTMVADVKGLPTPVYQLKAKLFRALYPGLELLEVSRAKSLRTRSGSSKRT